EVELFEEEFAAYCGVRFAVGVANGTEALHLALRALDVGPGDEVITAGNSFAATSLAIVYAGATPVLVDVDPTDFNIDVSLIEEAITPRTKAILPVHLYGQAARMDEIRQIADRHGLKVVEDAAQAHGAELLGRRAGSFGDAAGFSFYPGKNLGAFGDGGAIVTDNEAVYERLKLLRNYGQRVKNVHSELGFNSRLDTLQAAVLLVKLRHLPTWTEQRRAVAAWYGELLAEADVVRPVERDDARHVYHLYVVRHPQRDVLIDELREQGIQCGVHYPHPLHQAAPFRDCRTVPDGLPVCTQLAQEIVSLPMYPELTRAQVTRVAAAVCDVSAATSPVEV
ncbi:MAG: DegT/DnrJ/EryC1/StrS family aminotransferase, partial [Planctomycetaceae bacterium]|nr:DegT/DnrJ/EryC1/StrS family aminotransferase [Planctomycetaceae bacterium]